MSYAGRDSGAGSRSQIVPRSQGIDPAGHLPTEKVGCQKLRGQSRIEMKY